MVGKCETLEMNDNILKSRNYAGDFMTDITLE